MREPSK
jgi:hypothetical protein